MRQEDAGVDDGGVGQARDDASQRVGAVPVEQLPEDGARRSRACNGAGLGKAARGAEASFLDEGPYAAGDATLQPTESGGGHASRYEQLGAAIRHYLGEFRQPLANEWRGHVEAACCRPAEHQ